MKFRKINKWAISYVVWVVEDAGDFQKKFLRFAENFKNQKD